MRNSRPRDQKTDRSGRRVSSTGSESDARVAAHDITQRHVSHVGHGSSGRSGHVISGGDPLSGEDGKRRQKDWETRIRTYTPPNVSGDAEMIYDEETAGKNQIQDQIVATISLLDPDLAAIVDAWPSFPKHIQVTILTVVNAASRTTR